LKEIQEAMKLSPKKESIWIEAGAAEWDLGNAKGAQTAFNTAYALGPQFPELAIYAAIGNIAIGNIAAADKILIDAYGTTNVDSDTLAVAYYRTKNWPRLIALWKMRTAKPDATAQAWFSLAAVYYTAGDKATATAVIKEAIARFPDAASAGADAIKQIQGQ